MNEKAENIVWHETAVTKQERRKKMDIKALFYGSRVYPLQGNRVSPMHCLTPFSNKGNKSMFWTEIMSVMD